PDAQEAVNHARSLSKAFRAVAGAAAPSVVSIEVVPNGARRPMQGMGPMGVPMGMGTGFIVDHDGHVVTNNHVVRMGGRIRVRLNDGRETQASMVGADPETDIAVLRIDLPDLRPIAFGDSEQAEVGDWVLALGAPFGLRDTVTAGIISAKGREVGLSPLENYLQTDATINPGNSGGPLVGMDGRVVGINTAIESRSGGSDGIGFAIPAGMARDVVDSIIAGGAPARGFLGVQMQPTLVRGASGTVTATGVLVSSVVADGPAAQAGIVPGDVIVRINGNDTPDMRRVMREIRLCKPGAECAVELLRDGETVQVRAVLEESPARMAAAAPAAPPAPRPAPRIIVPDHLRQR
ncbi:MAG: putative periplasmic serine endoprotease DegP-like precursor, partial [Planctomycetota bacterium]